MIDLLPTLLSIAGLARGSDFLDHAPVNYSLGKSFEDCELRFPAAKVDRDSAIASYGGERAFQGEFQHMTAIGWTRSESTIDYLCGGSLITWKFILTAAHCAVDFNNLPPDTVRLGDTDLASTADDEFAQQIPIARFVKHPRYRESRKYYDIALVELERKVIPNDAICVACVWREPEAPAALMDAVGFGALGYGEKLSPTLQKVQLHALNAALCAERLRVDQLCAHSKTMDTCEGDSGGPLQTRLHDVFGNIFPLVVGVVSFGTPCIDGSTGVYTRVSSYLDWIEQEVNQSLSYEVCTGVNICDRKLNPSISASIDPKWTKSRVGLLWKETETDIYQCGGLLIDYRFVITSADCVTSSRGPPRFVASNINSDRAPIEDVFVHPRYKKGQPHFDIAIIKLRKYANLEEMNPVCPWSEQKDGDWREFNVMIGASIPEMRSYVDDFNVSTKSLVQYVVHGEDCSAGEDVADGDLACISNEAALVPGFCQVDYGGPAMTKYYDEQFKVHGIVSRLTQRCGSNVMFTRLEPHREWLESIVFKQLHERLVFSDK
uniref:Peptidase S1 domain-containing protein n=1 Tax=Anopheles christyi TaxID=43041 RepID=A0A182KC64_9DIPT